LIEGGSILQAVVTSFDPTGDGGLPLLKLAFRNEQQPSTRRHHGKQATSSQQMGKEIVFDVKELKAGDGPFSGTVVSVPPKSKAAFVDIGAGHRNKRGEGPAMTRVLGMLRFDDLNKVDSSKEKASLQLDSSMKQQEAKVNDRSWIEQALDSIEYDDDATVDRLFSADEELDIDQLFEEGEEIVEDLEVTMDGDILSYQDPESGEKVTVGSLADDDEDGEDSIGEDDDFFAGLTPQERLVKVAELMDNCTSSSSGGTRTLKRKFVNVGDEVDVYIQAVSKQSARFLLTIHPDVQNMKQVKSEAEAEKKLKRLISKMGGDIQNILKLKGTLCDGIVKATSNTGDWVYVQPELEGLPVGVAEIGDVSGLSQGDSVRIRLEGIDESRGQLAMTVIERLP
jgi:hypothetical protein